MAERTRTCGARRVATMAMTVLALVGGAGCGRLDTPGPLSSGQHRLTGEFDDISTLELPPPTYPWEATVDVGSDEWCVNRLTIDGAPVSIPGGEACGSLAGDAAGVPLGESARGAVFGIYAPGHRAASVSGGEATGTRSSMGWSQDGPFVLVLLENTADGSVRLLDSSRRSTDIPVG